MKGKQEWESIAVALLPCHCIASSPAWCCLLSHCEWWRFAAFYVLWDENLPCFPPPCLPSPTDTLLSKYHAHTHIYIHAQLHRRAFSLQLHSGVNWEAGSITSWKKAWSKQLLLSWGVFHCCGIWSCALMVPDCWCFCDLWRWSVCFLVNYVLVACHWRSWALLTWSAVNCMHAKLISNKKAFLGG